MGSSPSGRANAVPTRVSAVENSSKPGEKANAHPLSDAVESFLLTKQVGGCTLCNASDLSLVAGEFIAAVSEATALAVRGFFANL